MERVPPCISATLLRAARCGARGGNGPVRFGSLDAQPFGRQAPIHGLVANVGSRTIRCHGRSGTQRVSTGGRVSGRAARRAFRGESIAPRVILRAPFPVGTIRDKKVRRRSGLRTATVAPPGHEHPVESMYCHRPSQSSKDREFPGIILPAKPRTCWDWQRGTRFFSPRRRPAPSGQLPMILTSLTPWRRLSRSWPGTGMRFASSRSDAVDPVRVAMPRAAPWPVARRSNRA